MHDENSIVYNNNIIQAINEAAEKCIQKSKNTTRAKNRLYWNKNCTEAIKIDIKQKEKCEKAKIYKIASCIERKKS